MLVIGGVKVKDKAGMINFLAPKVDKFLIGGAVANTFLKAKGENVSQSKVDEEMVPECKKMLDKYWDKIVLPEDFVKEDLGAGNFRILDIGSDTQEKYRREILNAGSIFWNGNLGYTEDERYKAGTAAVVKAIIDNNFATKVAAGGDTVGFLDQMNVQASFSFVSTGGGAALEFLAGKKLPGIEALNRQITKTQDTSNK
jgi:phosphoglycerate kinase